MIRDPSDGTVRNPRTDFDKRGDMILSKETSGLPEGSAKPKDQARLDKSREWLKEYRNRKPEQGT